MKLITRRRRCWRACAAVLMCSTQIKVNFTFGELIIASSKSTLIICGLCPYSPMERPRDLLPAVMHEFVLINQTVVYLNIYILHIVYQTLWYNLYVLYNIYNKLCPLILLLLITFLLIWYTHSVITYLVSIKFITDRVVCNENEERNWELVTAADHSFKKKILLQLIYSTCSTEENGTASRTGDGFSFLNLLLVTDRATHTVHIGRWSMTL
jgi:hypothetical protein